MFRREIFGEFDSGKVAEKKPDYKVDGKLNEDKISQLVNLTQQIYLIAERELKLTGFWDSIPARNKLKADLQKILLSPDFAKMPNIVKNRARIITRIMEIAEKNNDRILYAE